MAVSLTEIALVESRGDKSLAQIKLTPFAHMHKPLFQPTDGHCVGFGLYHVGILSDRWHLYFERL